MAAQVARVDLAKMILTQLGIGTGWRHTGAWRGLVAWAGPESGWDTPCNGVSGHGARFNILNTTLDLGGCVGGLYNTNPGVKNYISALCGAEAVALTLKNTPDRGYDAVIAALAKPFGKGRDVLHAVAQSDWGTFKHPDGSANIAFADAIYDTYLNNRVHYNGVLVGP